jgi:CDP-diacylglycerol--glycerol-3-phosphate 3-phosphatidyltransferase
MQHVPNALSFIRLLATVPLVVLVLLNRPVFYMAAVVIFALSAFTDLLDGRIARRYKLVSKLGIFLDLTADKVYVSGILIAMVQVALLPAWIVLIIITREFVITGLRSLAASEGRVIPAGKWGKQKTTITLVAIGGILLARALGSPGAYPTALTLGPAVAAPAIPNILLFVAYALMLLAALWTIISGTEYLIGVSALLREQIRPQSGVTG